MENLWFIAVACIALLILFAFTNGFHDTANVVATVIASRVMTPTQAILLVTVFTFLGPLLAGTAVADTVGNFVILDDLPAGMGIGVVLSGVAGAALLNFLTWWFGLPSSSSHALVGGLTGVVLVTTGADHVVWGWQILLEEGRWTGLTKIFAALLISPLAGFVVGLLLHKSMRLLLRGAKPNINQHLGRFQWLGAAWLAFAHGANDAQKSMGVITMVLVLAGFIPQFEVPLWVILLCASAITLGTVSGGWRIIRTVGFGIYRLRRLHAFESQLSSAMVISGAAFVGGPVSTTHVVNSTIMGIGAAERAKAVRWSKAAEIGFTWLVTLPAAGLFAIGVHFLLTRWWL